MDKNVPKLKNHSFLSCIFHCAFNTLAQSVSFSVERAHRFNFLHVLTMWRISINALLFWHISAAHAQIHGEAAVYVKVGSTISLTCTINLYSVPPPDITWYHGSKVNKH